MSKPELAAALRQHLDSWRAEAHPITHRYHAYTALLPAELLALSALLADDAHVYFAREIDSELHGQPLHLDWSLGLFLEQSR